MDRNHAALVKFSSISECFGREEFYRKFFKKLNKLLSASYGEQETKKILKMMSSNHIRLRNAEIFFSTGESIYEPSAKPFDSQKDLGNFFCETLINCSKLSSEGIETIYLNWFLIHVTLIISYWKHKSKSSVVRKEYFPQLQTLMDSFMASLCTHSKKCPFVFRIVDKRIFKALCNEIGISDAPFSPYGTVLSAMFNACDKLKEIAGVAHKPKFEMLLSVYKDARKNQENFLASVFSTLPCQIRKATSTLTSLSEDSIELNTALEFIRANSIHPAINLETVKKELKRIEKRPWYTYSSFHRQNYDIDLELSLPRSILSSHNVNFVYVALENIKEIVHPALAEVEVQCKNLPLLKLDAKIDAAVKLCLLKYREHQRLVKVRGITTKGVLRIILKNVSPLNDDTLKYIEERKKKIESLYNRGINIMVEFDEKECMSKFGNSYPTHIRIISDIHADVNEGMGYYFDFGDDFVIDCGDTSGDCVSTSNWIRTNIKQGLFTAGNHLGYSQPFPELNGDHNVPKWGCKIHENNTLNGQSKILGKEFARGDVNYVVNGCQEYQGIYFLGSPLYTDFRLYGKDKREELMDYAKHRMNDYRVTKAFVECDFVSNLDEWDRIRIAKNQIITPEPMFFVIKHTKAMKFLTLKIRELQGNPIVVFTHHAPLTYSIEDKYKNDPLSAAFASDLRELFKKFSGIRLWCHGHVHSKFDYIYVRKCKDGTIAETRVVCNPFGYYFENPDDPATYGKRISIKDIKSTKKWTTILAKEIAEGKVKVYEDLDD